MKLEVFEDKKWTINLCHEAILLILALGLAVNSYSLE